LQESPHDKYEYDGGDSSEDDSILESNGELIFVGASVDQDLQCTEAYVVDDEIDLDDENVIDLQLELPTLFSLNAAHQLAPIWCAKMYISSYIVLSGVGSCLILGN
jgi:hypothetical protein